MKTAMSMSILALFSQVTFAQATAAPDLTSQINALDERVKILEKDVSDIKAGKLKANLDHPYVSTKQLLNFSVTSVLSIYSYTYSNFKQVLTNVRPFFTGDGYDSYMKALEDSKNMEAVQTKQLVVAASLNGEPRILKEGIVNNVYNWQVQIPLTVLYQSARESFRQNLLVTLDIGRVDEAVNVQGIAIQSFNAAEDKAPSQTEAAGTSDTPKIFQ